MPIPRRDGRRGDPPVAIAIRYEAQRTARASSAGKVGIACWSDASNSRRTTCAQSGSCLRLLGIAPYPCTLLLPRNSRERSRQGCIALHGHMFRRRTDLCRGRHRRRRSEQRREMARFGDYGRRFVRRGGYVIIALA